MAERDVHVTLVLEIEKYPSLYNYKLAEYSRKDTTDKIWKDISKKTHLTVNDCKEKWRNIRSTFLRSMKTSPDGSKPKKPYYLRDYLSFILPYIKIKSKKRGHIPPVASNNSDDEEEQETSVEEERAIVSKEEPVATIGNSQGARKRRHNERESPMLILLKNKIEKANEPVQTHTNQTKMNNFFLSLLSEFDDMTDNEIRTFKIKVLQLIDEMKQNRQLSSPSTTRESYDSPGIHADHYSIIKQEIPDSSSPVHITFD